MDQDREMSRDRAVTSKSARESGFGRRVIPLALVMAMLSMMGIAGWAGWRAMRPQRAELRVAINPWPGYEYATLAREKGYFRDEGVAVRLLDLSSLGDCVRAFERGQADGFFGTVTEVLRSREQSSRGAKVVMVAVNLA